MKVLYGIQGTGNGHLSRANDIVPILQKKVRLDLLVSGIQADVGIPFEIKYRLKGLSFIFGKKGGVDIWNTYKKSNVHRLRKEIRSLPVEDYDLVINDFEPVSSWAARVKKVPCIALSHQAAVINEKAPKPSKSDWVGKFILEHYSPADWKYGFHFKNYDENIFTPVIRRQVRDQDIGNKGHYTVYLPSYGSDLIVKKLSRFKDVKWEVFSKDSTKAVRKKNVFITPISNEAFITSMAASEGVLCGAGFETPAEALFLGKKVMVVPMKRQYEQQCNAAALKNMGVPVMKNLKRKRLFKIESWINSNDRVPVNYPDITQNIIDQMLDKHLLNGRSQ
jgi:uncharacterized protein (TIGR00661 family)